MSKPLTFTLTGNCVTAYQNTLGSQKERGYLENCIDRFDKAKANQQREIFGKYAVCLGRKVGDQALSHQVRCSVSSQVSDRLSKIANYYNSWELSPLARVIVMADAYSNNPDLF